MPLRIGHRGAAGYAPENTLDSISHALSLGVDVVEVDVQRTVDGHLVIMHDKRVDRTTNGSGRVDALTLEELRSLNAGNGQAVPTLHEVLAVASGRAGVMLELISEGIADQLSTEVRAFRFKGTVLYASFLHKELLAIRSAEPHAQTMALLEGVPVSETGFALDARVNHVGLSLDSITQSFVEALHSASFGVFVYTVNDRRDIVWVKSLAVEGIISDFPDLL
jgi:glycerophosphoryl diester phosphodiesterase